MGFKLLDFELRNQIVTIPNQKNSENNNAQICLTILSHNGRQIFHIFTPPGFLVSL